MHLVIWRFVGLMGWLAAQSAFGVGQVVRLMIGLSSVFHERAFDCGCVVRSMVGEM